jgi:hypothetical protein
MKIDMQAACAFAQMGAMNEVRFPGNQGGWSEELDLYIQMAKEFTKAMKAKGSSYYPNYDEVIDNWYDELEKYWDVHAPKLFLFPDPQTA